MGGFCGIQFVNNPLNFATGDFLYRYNSEYYKYNTTQWTCPSGGSGQYKFHLKIKITVGTNYRPDYTKLRFLQSRLNSYNTSEGVDLIAGVNIIDKDFIFSCNETDLITIFFNCSAIISFGPLEILEQYLSISKLE
jgi:hypothetical protein